MTNCCRKCMKIFCENRDNIEDCPDCVSEVYLMLQKLMKLEGNNVNENNFGKKSEKFF